MSDKQKKYMRSLGILALVVWAVYITFVGPIRISPAQAASFVFRHDGGCRWVTTSDTDTKKTVAVVADYWFPNGTFSNPNLAPGPGGRAWGAPGYGGSSTWTIGVPVSTRELACESNEYMKGFWISNGNASSYNYIQPRLLCCKFNQI